MCEALNLFFVVLISSIKALAPDLEPLFLHFYHLRSRLCFFSVYR